MAANEFVCGRHKAFIYKRGGTEFVDEVTPCSMVRWQRARDDISTAEVAVPTTECCELLGDLRCVIHELHIERDGEVVWQGPITRLEYEFDLVRIFAEDLIWPAKRYVIKQGYSNAFPNIGVVLDTVHAELIACFSLDGDPWNMLPGLLPLYNPSGGDPRTARAVRRLQTYVWD